MGHVFLMTPFVPVGDGAGALLPDADAVQLRAQVRCAQACGRVALHLTPTWPYYMTNHALPYYTT